MLVTVPMMVILNFCLNDPWLSAVEKISLLLKEHIFSPLLMPSQPTWYVFSNAFLERYSQCSVIRQQCLSPPFTSLEASV